MPCVPQRLAQILHKDTQKVPVGPSRTDLVEEQPLLFPHQITVEELEQCAPSLADIEERLPKAQLHDFLDRLRVQLHIKVQLVTFKNCNV